MTGLICDRDLCPVEKLMRAMESIRLQQVAPGGKPAWGESDTWVSCKVCHKTPGWRRTKDGLVKAL